MNQVIVNAIAEHKLTVFPLEKGTSLILTGIVEVLPQIKRLNCVHFTKLRHQMPEFCIIALAIRGSAKIYQGLILASVIELAD